MKKSLSDKLKTARLDKGLTLTALAEKAGCTKSYVWALESGRAENPNPSAQLLISLADALDVDIYYFFHGHVDDLETSIDKKFYEDYKRLNAAKKQQVRQLLKIVVEEEKVNAS